MAVQMIPLASAIDRKGVRCQINASGMQLKRLAFSPLLLILLQACSSIAQRPADVVASRADSQTVIYVARRGWHIDIGFSTSDIEVPLASLGAQFTAAQYLFFGFGDRHYLLANNKDFPGMLGALWPGEAVVLVTALGAAPEEAFGSREVIRLQVGAAALRSAQEFVRDSILQENGAARLYGKGPYDGSLYFAAVPKYSALHTCNTWAAEALRATGLPVHSRGVVFASQLWSQTRRIQNAANTLIGHNLTSAAAMRH
jgi:uncharacterized protein (TIGR02117 family)